MPQRQPDTTDTQKHQGPGRRLRSSAAAAAAENVGREISVRHAGEIGQLAAHDEYRAAQTDDPKREPLVATRAEADQAVIGVVYETAAEDGVRECRG